MSDALHLPLRCRFVGVAQISMSGMKRGMKGRKTVMSGSVVPKHGVEGSERI
jgi:hypothetical protein